MKRPTRSRLDDVNEDELYRLFSSREFLQKLKKAGNYTMQSGHESGFLGYRRTNRTFHLSEVTEGGTDQCDQDYHSGSDLYEILDLHFHPNEDEPINPSDGDLNQANTDYLVLGHLLGVGQIKRDKTIDVLLLQRTHRLLPTDVEELWGDFCQAYFTSTKEVADFYEESGHYKSGIITFKPNGRLYVPDFSADVFRKFAHQVDLSKLE